jgi:hypothetical protein
MGKPYLMNIVIPDKTAKLTMHSQDVVRGDPLYAVRRAGTADPGGEPFADLSDCH